MGWGKRGKVPAPLRSQERLAQIIIVVLLVAALAVAAYAWILERSPSAPQVVSGQASPSATGSADTGANAGRGAVLVPYPGSSLPAVPSGDHTDYAGQVTQVSDGDTVRFRTGGRELRIRIDSIDSPENTASPERPGQAYAQAARDHLAQWIRGRQLTARCYEIDQYDRSVCALLDEKGESAGRAQVAAGYAWAYTAARGRYLRDRAMPELQAGAQQKRLGLWARDGATAPWTWRYDCWRQRQCD